MKSDKHRLERAGKRKGKRKKQTPVQIVLMKQNNAGVATICLAELVI